MSFQLWSTSWIISIIFEILIGLFNPFGILGKQYIHWYPVRGKVIIPKRNILDITFGKIINILSFNLGNIIIYISILNGLDIKVHMKSCYLNALVANLSSSKPDIESVNSEKQNYNEVNSGKSSPSQVSAYLTYFSGILQFLKIKLSIILEDLDIMVATHDAAADVSQISSKLQHMSIDCGFVFGTLYSKVSYQEVFLILQNSIQLLHSSAFNFGAEFNLSSKRINSSVELGGSTQFNFSSEIGFFLIDYLRLILKCHQETLNFKYLSVDDMTLIEIASSLTENVATRSAMSFCSGIDIQLAVADFGVYNVDLCDISKEVISFKTVSFTASYDERITGQLVIDRVSSGGQISHNLSDPFMKISVSSTNNEIIVTSFMPSINLTINTFTLGLFIFLSNELGHIVKTNSLILKCLVKKSYLRQKSRKSKPSDKLYTVSFVCESVSLKLINNTPLLSSQDSSVAVDCLFSNIQYDSKKCKDFDHKIILSSTLKIDCIAISSNDVINPKKDLIINGLSFTTSNINIESFDTEYLSLLSYCPLHIFSEYEDFFYFKQSISSKCNIKNIDINLDSQSITSLGFIIGSFSKSKPNWIHGIKSPFEVLNIETDSFVNICRFYLEINRISLKLCDTLHPDSYNCFEMQIDHGMKYTIDSIPGFMNKSNFYISDQSLKARVSSNQNSIDLFELQFLDSGCEYLDENLGLEFKDCLQNISTHDLSHSKNYLCLSSLLLPSESFLKSHQLYGISYKLSAMKVEVSQFIANIDVLYLKPLLCSIGYFNTSKALASKYFIKYLSNHIYLQLTDDCNRSLINIREARCQPMNNPTSVFSMSINDIDIILNHDTIPCFQLRTDCLHLKNISFGPMISQFSSYIEGLTVIDHTLPSSTHKFMIGSGGDGKQIFNNAIELHMTSCIGEASLLEVRLEDIEVFYLQRSTITLVNFLRDFFIPGIKSNLQHQFNLLVEFPDLTPSSLYDRDSIGFAKRGFFRMCISSRRMQIHLPISSSSADSLSVLIPHLVFYKSCPEKDIQAPNYCKGPYLEKRLWISQLKNINSFMSLLFNGTSNNIISWKSSLFQMLENSIAPSSFICGRGAKYSKFDFCLIDTTLCTWCNQNAITESLTLECQLIIKQTLGFPTGLEEEVIENETYVFTSHEIRNRFEIIIFSQEINWILAQGQYQSIVYLIQQNIGEPTKIVPEIFQIPKLQQVMLSENVFGKYTMRLDLPIFSTVPIHFKVGKIECIENDSKYYELVQKLPKPTIILNKESSKSTIPVTSYHYYYRRRLYEVNVSTNTSIRQNLSFRDNFANVNELENQYLEMDSFYPVVGDSIISIVFQDLEIDFYRRHYGGGNGITVQASTFVLVDSSHRNNNSFDQKMSVDGENDDFDPNDKFMASDIEDISYHNIGLIPMDRIILGPKSLSQFNNLDSQQSLSTHPIIYRQQGVGNLRRCDVAISDSVVIIHLVPIMNAMRYFTESSQLSFKRNVKIYESQGFGVFDYRNSLDVEVHTKNTVFCMPLISKYGGINAICIHNDLDYTQAWRGFLNSGPARVSMNIICNISSVFISPLQEVRLIGTKSMIESCAIAANITRSVLAATSDLERNLSILEKQMQFGMWCRESNRLESSPLQYRVTSFTIQPYTSPQNENRRSSIQKTNSTDLHDFTIPRFLVINASIKDIVFLNSAIQQMNSSLKYRTPQPPIEQKFYKLLTEFSDISHLHHLTHYIVHVPLKLSNSDPDIETHAHLCNLQFVLKNNTYNMKLLKAELSNIQLNYIKKDNKLHSACELQVSCNYFNETSDLWEPILESLNITSIAASDQSDSSAESNSIRSNYNTRMDIFSSPVEINVPLLSVNTLIRKLKLADVVTTSSTKIPPYLIINELGVNVNITIGMGNSNIVSDVIKTNSQLPVELDKLKTNRILVNDSLDNEIINPDEMEHLLNISFSMSGIKASSTEMFESIHPLPIDREGTSMFMMGRKKGADKKAQLDIPYVILHMTIKEDGGRQIVIKSIFSLRNLTSRSFHLSIRLHHQSSSKLLQPGEEWNVPLHLAYPQSAVYFMDSRSLWLEALPNLQSLINQGYWGSPSKLRAELIVCPAEVAVSNDNTTEEILNDYVLMLRPESRDPKSPLTSHVPIRYPTKDFGRSANAGPSTISKVSSDIYNMRFQGAGSINESVQPLFLNLMAPLQLCSVVSEPLLYRIVDGNGCISSEGTLLPGEVINIHSLSRMYSSNIYLSVRLINYCWSQWRKIFAVSHPYPTSERLIEFHLPTMDLLYRDKDLKLPSLDLVCHMREHFLRISSLIQVENRTGISLEYSEGNEASEEQYLPQLSCLPVHKCIETSNKKISANIIRRRQFKYFKKNVDLVQRTMSPPQYEEAEEDVFQLQEDVTVDSEDDEDEEKEEDAVIDYSRPSSLRRIQVLNSVKMNESSESINSLSAVRPVTLIIHLPQDHLQFVVIDVTSDMKLKDVFSRISHRLGHTSDSQNISNYIFMIWENGKYGTAPLDSFQVSDEGDDDNYTDPDNSVKANPTLMNSAVGLPTPKIRNRDKTIQESNLNSAFPIHMRYGMLADCTFENIFSMNSTVEMLGAKLRLRLCHVSEININQQINKISIEVEQNETKLSKLFSKTKATYHAPFFQWTSESVPFYKNKLIGFSNSINVRTSMSQEWSKGLDISKLEYGSSNNFINVPISSGSDLCYELGINAEKSRGFLQNISSICFVPKHILISKLVEDICIRQIDVEDESLSVALPTKKAVVFHHMNQKSKLVQVRRAIINDKDTSKHKYPSSWIGEIDISKIGICFAKLLNPTRIIKIRTEMLGSSFISTFTELNPRWPPYRIDNLTSFNIRIKQILSDLANDDKMIQTKDLEGKRGEDFTNLSKDENFLWEDVNSNSRIPFALDYPKSSSFVIIDFPQGSKSRYIKVDLSSIIHKKKVRLMKSVRESSGPLAEGMLLRRTIDSSTTWTPCYCILKPGVIFVFRDSSRSELLETIRLTNNNKTVLQLAKVMQYSEKPVESSTLGLGFHLSNSVSTVDINSDLAIAVKNSEINHKRIFLLRLADELQLFRAFRVMMNNKGDYIDESEENDDFDENEQEVEATINFEDEMESANSSFLKNLLSDGISIEYLFDGLQHRWIEATKVMEAIIKMKAAVDETDAFELLNTLSSEGMIVWRVFKSESQDTVNKLSSPRSLLEQLDSLKNMELSIRGLVINPELLSIANQDTQKLDTMLDELTSEIHAFTIIPTDNAVKSHFRCTSLMEYLGWLQGCRQSIEMAWIEAFCRDYDTDGDDNLDFIHTNVYISVRADGPTMVLEVNEDTSNSTFNFSPEKLSTMKVVNQANITTMSDYLIESSFVVPSFSLSLIDNEPAEMLYFKMKDINMSVNKSRTWVSMAATIQTIQVSNQLPNPLFPVTLFPRKTSKAYDSLKNISEKKKLAPTTLILPGLHQIGSNYPTLHLFFKQRFHVASQEPVSISTPKSAGDGDMESYDLDESNIRYFEIFTLWLAPMQLDLDEELLIRSIRYVNCIRQAIARNKANLSSFDSAQEEIEINQFVGNRTWGIIDADQIFQYYRLFRNVNEDLCYSYRSKNRLSSGIFFGLLQLHPLDIQLHFRSSPELQVSATATEMAIISIIMQIDSSRICLNALLVEHAFGSTAIFTEVIGKHYRTALWRQIQILIGSTDIIEGSVGLVANLGTGVYDLFYEPIDGLLDDNRSFLSGLSKGGKSLAAKTIGGTSAFTSKITGGISRGVSMLTLDSEFQRVRNSRRLVKSSTISEGLYVGTKELGKNILDGVTGIVTNPYRGWEQGGSVGFGFGVAKGILGVALKPTVGLLDLASRATEGLRNTAFNSLDATDTTNDHSVSTLRIPRTFGRGNSLLPYNGARAAAQYLVDRLSSFSRNSRIRVVYHEHFIRRVSNFDETTKTFIPEYPGIDEAWGMKSDSSFVTVVSQDSISLLNIKSSSSSKNLDVSLMWFCPAMSLEGLTSDARGDLILNIEEPVVFGSPSSFWIQSQAAVVVDRQAQDFIVLQQLLEQTMGVSKSRKHPLKPLGGLVCTDVLKKVTKGIKSLVLSPTRHNFQLFGSVLYEYTSILNNSTKSESNVTSDANGGVSSSTQQNSETKYPSDYYFAEEINRQFGVSTSKGIVNQNIGSGNNSITDDDTSIKPDGYLSHVYPLVDVNITGPNAEGSNKYSVSISRKDNQNMRILKRESSEGYLFEYRKGVLTLIFPSKEIAEIWRHYLSSHVVNGHSSDIIEGSTILSRGNNLAMLSSNSSLENGEDIPPTSVLKKLAIPSSGAHSSITEQLKVEIVKTMSAMKR